MTKEKYGSKHYAAIGKRGGEAKLKKYGPDYFKKLSAIGVAARQKKRQEKSAVE